MMEVAIAAQEMEVEAQYWDNVANQLVNILRRKPLELAEVCARFRDQGLWRHVTDPEGKPFLTIIEWAASKGLRRASYFAYVRVWDGIKHLPPTVRDSLTKENAEELLRLPPASRADPDILGKAQTLHGEEFAKEIDGRLERDHHTPMIERKTNFRVRMYLSQAEMIMEHLKEFCAVNDLGDDIARALELIFVEWASERTIGKPSTIYLVESAMVNTIVELRQALRAKDSNMSLEEQNLHLFEHLEKACEIIMQIPSVARDKRVVVLGS